MLDTLGYVERGVTFREKELIQVLKWVMNSLATLPLVAEVYNPLAVCGRTFHSSDH